MSDNPNQEIEALRQAWAGIQAPEPFRALAEEDAATQQAVAWLQSALQSIAPAKPAIRKSRRGPILRLLTLAAAAALLILLNSPNQPNDTEPFQASGTVAPEPSIEVLASSRDRLDLRSGPVRLTLIHTTPTPANP